MLSRYHFCRTFRRVTGISPTQFLSALRMEEAKNLLETTCLSVTEISIQVGYSSMSTFCTRFAASVGVSPTMYRRAGDAISELHLRPSPLPPSGATVQGRLLSPADEQVTGPVFIGLFPERIAQGRPAGYAMLDQPDRFELTQVPCGRWHLLVHTKAGEEGLPMDGHRMIAFAGPIIVRPATAATVDLRLRPAIPTDPPAVLALPRPLGAGNRAAATTRPDHVSV